jgi:hypothetical protein
MGGHSTVLSDLIDTDLTDEELMGVGLLLLVAGIDTTANMLALGTFALLSHPAQWAALRADPEIADKAVEELLRYLSVAKTFQRTALEDVELGGQTIKAGSTVILSYNTANRDPGRFASPDTLDVRGMPPGTWPSAMAFTTALASNSPASRCRSPSARWSSACRLCAWTSRARSRHAPRSGGHLRSEESHPTPRSARRSLHTGAPARPCAGRRRLRLVATRLEEPVDWSPDR